MQSSDEVIGVVVVFIEVITYPADLEVGTAAVHAGFT